MKRRMYLGNKLEKLFEMQKALDGFVAMQHPEKTNKNLSEWVIGLTIAMESEIDEIRREVNWKWWKGEKQIDFNLLHSEVIDMWHFLISLSYRVGLSPDDVMKIYLEKNEENFKRQQGLSSEGKDYRNA